MVKRWVACLAVAIGVAVRLWQYFVNASIWVDEAAIARNVLDRNPAQLLTPLNYGQVAPPGFLLGVKFIAATFGSSEYALRLLPLIAGLLSVVLFLRLARAVLRPVASTVGVLLFAIAVPLVLFACNLKQYSSDVAIAVLVIIVALHLQQSVLRPVSVCVYGLAALPLLFFSQAAVFSLTVAGAVLFVDALAGHRPDKWYRFGMIGLWATSVIGVALFSLRLMSPYDKIYLNQFWDRGFLPKEEAIQWLWRTLQTIFGGPPNPGMYDGSLHYPVAAVCVALFVIGAVALCIQRPAVGALLTGPVLLVLLAAAVHAYPFGTRISLFLLPLFLLLMVAGADFCGRIVTRRSPGEYVPVLLIPIAVIAFWQWRPPQRFEHIRPVIQYVSDHWKPGDSLWVYYGAGQAFEYYDKRIPIQGDVKIGDCDRTDPREYLRQVDIERGRSRVWILMCHSSAFYRINERQLLIAYLDNIGRRMHAFHAPPEDKDPNRAAVYLYDLSIPEKLASTSAEEFPIRNSPPPQTWTCYGGMSPLGENPRVLEAVKNLSPP